MERRSASSATVSELFNGGNYVVWSVQVKTYLIAQDLWGIVRGTDVCPEQEDEAAFQVWTRRDAMTLHVIQTSCEPRICLSISRITSAKVAWDTLEAIKNLRKEFREFTMEDLGIFLSLYMLKRFIDKVGLGSERYDKITKRNLKYGTVSLKKTMMSIHTSHFQKQIKHSKIILGLIDKELSIHTSHLNMNNYINKIDIH